MAAIGTLSAGISHEIKNPLQVIKGVVEMIKLNKKFGVYDNMNKEQYIAVVEDVSERILGAVARAVGVIDRLSGFAKKPKELKIETVNLEKAIEGALDFLKSEFDYFSITVKKNFDPSCPDVLADLHALEEVILNILVNARHAVMEKGTVSVSTVNRGGEVEITIQDSGQGIKPENLEKIFDPFFTTKDTTRNSDPASIKGTGLGLFIVRETIKRFGGRISVESEIERGTTFHIVLPAPHVEEARVVTAKKEPGT
jgi:signal transduction histidine kinase